MIFMSLLILLLVCMSSTIVNGGYGIVKPKIEEQDVQ